MPDAVQTIRQAHIAAQILEDKSPIKGIYVLYCGKLWKLFGSMPIGSNGVGFSLCPIDGKSKIGRMEYVTVSWDHPAEALPFFVETSAPVT